LSSLICSSEIEPHACVVPRDGIDAFEAHASHEMLADSQPTVSDR
jgi:hypothetical protein